MLEVRIAVRKRPKYASRESGDSVEVVERAKGGLSVIMADGQGSGWSAKGTSNLVVTKAVTLLSEGVRDGAVARAVHDYLYAVKHGRVSAEMTLISADLQTRTVLVSRNSHCPVVISGPEGGRILGRDVAPIGVQRTMKPEITELPLGPGLIVLAFTDGVWEAGKRSGQGWSGEDFLDFLRGYEPGDAALIAEHLLMQMEDLDQGRPGDDMSVVVMTVGEIQEKEWRTLDLSFPVR